jgi:hypothetical protein
MTLAAVLFLSPGLMGVAAGLLCLTLIIAAARGVRLGRAASLLVAAGGACWAVAAGSPAWDRPLVRLVAVMVDLSPSTRGAAYRDRVQLDRRIAELIGTTPHEVFAFAGGAPQSLPIGPTLGDIPCDRTVFAPPSGADAVLLFSDGRFDPPADAPTTFAVIDPSLEHPDDAAVRELRWSGDRVWATVAATGPMTLRWAGAEPATIDVTGGGVVSARATAAEVTAAVSGGDRWPENDRLTIHAPPPPIAERWWVGGSPPPGWRPVDLPTDPAAYLSPGVIVLDDVSADALSTEQQRRLSQYVRDLGGGLVIGGGPSAFAAGGYGSTPLDGLSPLASDPPRPAERWVVLVDGSGSMANGDGPGPTPWQIECDAVARVLPMLPPADIARVGSFAATVTWWTDNLPAADAAAARLPPPGVTAGGPTNLVAAVRRVADAATPTHLLLMSDADADLPDPAGLSAALVAHHVTLHVLAIGNGSALPALRSIATATGGSVVQQSDPGQWVSAARRLARQAVPRRYVEQPTDVRWIGVTGPRRTPAWNHTWLKPSAEMLARGPDAPLAAEWNAGSGRSAAVAFPAGSDLLARLAERVAAEPHDPRFTVSCDAGSDLRVSVDAVDGKRYLNGLAITLQLDDGKPAVPFEQTGPGLYGAVIAAPRRPTLATVRAAGLVIGRFAVAGRYPPEFDAVGTDRAALAELADRTGGAVIEPASVGPVTFPGPRRQTDLTPELATAGAAAVAAGLVLWRRRGA